MDGNGMDTEAGRIDVVSCGIGFPKDAETLGLIGRADVVYGSRALLAACPVEARLTRIIGAKAVRMRRTPSPCAGSGGMSWYWPREMRCTMGSAVRFPAWPTPMTLLCIIPALPLFRRCFTGSACLGRTPRPVQRPLRRSLARRAIAEAPLSVAYAGSRYPAMLSRRPCSNSIPRPPGAPPSSPNGSARPKNASFQARWRIWPARNAAPRPSCFCSRPLGTASLIPSPGLLTMRVPIPAFTKVPPYPTASPRRYSPLGSRKKTTNARTT